jgi:glycosyltransferase involved in cell wall biosynthesis
VIQLAKKYGVPVIFRALDVSHLIRKSLLSPLIKSAEKYVYQHVDVLSANNPAMARYCSTLGGRTKNTFINLPPLDVSHFAAKPRDERLAKGLGLTPADSIITYMGSFFHFSGLDTVIRELSKVAIANPALKLLLIGGGEQDAELKNLVQEHNLAGRVIFTGFIPYTDLPRYLQLSTVAINPMLSQPVSNTAFPQKVLQYMASDIPVVSTKLDGIFETFGAESGVIWTAGPEAVLAEAIALASDGARRKGAVQSQTDLVTRLLSVDRAVKEFEVIIENAIGAAN